MSTNELVPPVETQQRLVGVIRRVLGTTGLAASIEMDVELMSIGLDSMRAIDLLLELEGEFGVTFPDEMLTTETFRTPASLESALTALQRGS